jgi:hypothetical protein
MGVLDISIDVRKYCCRSLALLLLGSIANAARSNISSEFPKLFELDRLFILGIVVVERAFGADVGSCIVYDPVVSLLLSLSM